MVNFWQITVTHLFLEQISQGFFAGFNHAFLCSLVVFDPPPVVRLLFGHFFCYALMYVK